MASRPSSSMSQVGAQPNGLLVEGDRLLVGTMNPGIGGRGRGSSPGGKLLAIDLKTKQRTRLTMESLGGIDGIERWETGSLLVTDVAGSRLLSITRNGQVLTLMTFAQAGR